MIDIIRSPWDDSFRQILDGAETLLLCAPYVSRAGCNIIKGQAAKSCRSVQLLTNLSQKNMLSGVTDVEAIAELATQCPSVTVRTLPSLHAKIYVCDSRRAVVTSANLTTGGLIRNVEYGVHFTDPAIVASIQKDVLAYNRLASPISSDQLNELATAVRPLRQLQREIERAASDRIQLEFARQLDEMQVISLRMRAGNRPLHALFAEVILFVLRNGPATTEQIHSVVQTVHPDLCDDSIDRIIDGQSFGRKWKHAVRTAQQHLKRHGVIKLVGKLWQIDSK